MGFDRVLDGLDCNFLATGRAVLARTRRHRPDARRLIPWVGPVRARRRRNAAVAEFPVRQHRAPEEQLRVSQIPSPRLN
jgi:hypothetical protein